MKKEYEEFSTFLEQEKKEEAITYALDLLTNKQWNVIDLYTEVLAPSLNLMECKLQDKNLCIWKEHVRTAIVRTIVECCYPYVMEMKRSLNYSEGKTAVILCPPEEYHDLGARMAADFFTICGFDAIFVGSNTPYQDFYHAIDLIQPDLVAISVSNFYNLVPTKRIVEELKQKRNSKVKILVGGYAFDSNPNNIKIVGADAYIKTYQDIEKFTKDEVTL